MLSILRPISIWDILIMRRFSYICVCSFMICDDNIHIFNSERNSIYFHDDTFCIIPIKDNIFKNYAMENIVDLLRIILIKLTFQARIFPKFCLTCLILTNLRRNLNSLTLQTFYILHFIKCHSLYLTTFFILIFLVMT